MRVLFLGSGAFAMPAFEAIKASEHDVVGIVSQPDRPAGRGKQLTSTPLAMCAEAYGLDVLKVQDVNHPDVLHQLQSLRPDILVVIAFGQKLSDPLLALAPHGGINLHSSLLPKYRGAAPINWAVINNDKTAGVTVIEVTPVMDGGVILAKVETEIAPSETAGELHDRLADLGAPLLPQVLTALANHTATRQPQDPTLATKAPKLHREMAWVDWTQPAELVSARIRGLSPWPGVAVELLDPSGKPRTQATILKCLALPGPDHPPEKCGHVLPDKSIACAQGSIQILTLQPHGKKPMDLPAFANGYGFGPGSHLRSLVDRPTSTQPKS